MSISAVMPTYARTDIVFERGEGAWLYATDGRRFLDFGGGVAVTALGHAHPHLVAALQAQATKLYEQGKGTVADKISGTRFGDKLLRSNDQAMTVNGAHASSSTSANPSGPLS